MDRMGIEDSSYGWFHDYEDFDTDDVQPPICRIEDWTASQVWNDGRRQGGRELAQGAADAHMTRTRTFRATEFGCFEPYAVAIGEIRVVRVSPFACHAEYQVLLSTQYGVHASWKRYTDFNELAQISELSRFDNAVAAWKALQQTKRWFRCVEVNYLIAKCHLLERFLTELLGDIPTPGILLDFVGAEQPRPLDWDIEVVLS